MKEERINRAGAGYHCIVAARALKPTKDRCADLHDGVIVASKRKGKLLLVYLDSSNATCWVPCQLARVFYPDDLGSWRPPVVGVG